MRGRTRGSRHGRSRAGRQATPWHLRHTNAPKGMTPMSTERPAGSVGAAKSAGALLFPYRTPSSSFAYRRASITWSAATPPWAIWGLPPPLPPNLAAIDLMICPAL
jgi:hypothetical protein